MARPREFETADALDQIMGVFWEKGFEGTSMSDLMSATGLNKQSLYSAFGNKCEIYLAALNHYEATVMRPVSDMLKGPGNAIDRIGRMLQSVIDAACLNHDRRGCMIGNAAVDHAVLDKKSQEKVLGCVKKMETTLSGIVGEIGAYRDDRKLQRRRGRSLLATYFGMQVLAKAGVGRAALKDMRELALDDL